MTACIGRVVIFYQRFLKTIDRHILREWLGFLLIVVLATLGMLLVQCMIQDFGDLRNKGANIVDMGQYFAVRVPSFLSFVLPIILLVSLLYVLGRLHRGNEITAMRAAGLGYGQITRSIWVVGVLMCGVMWWLNASIVPWSVEKSLTMLQELGFRNEAKAATDAGSIGVTRMVTFDNDREGRIWFMNRYSRYAQRGYGVTVSEFTVRRQEKLRIYAKEAHLDKELGCWVFHNGRETLFDPETGAVTGSAPFDEKAVSYYKEAPELMLSFDVKPKDLSFFRLRQIMDYFEVLESPKLKIYAMRYYGILAGTFAPLIVILIAIPFAITGVRVNPAVGVSKSLGLFAIYFALEKVAESMGSQGILPPVVAACLPGAALLLIGGWFYARMR
ncbi:LPS export ABC transporter permease LptG [Ereboglobus sp. PH5-5]|nr:LPS export ABC transporter permease LptG [Ereboglobus sp. PH5-10]MDF9833540.1 LPS export ABC transporter permease LptG [Ereboglobus sp. PH5-5]